MFLDYMLFMTYSALMAMIIHRVTSDKHIRRWWLLKSAPYRGRAREFMRRVDWYVLTVSAFVAFDVLIVAVAVGLAWAR